MVFHFFDRDLSWLSFNKRLLIEAEKTTVPLFERLKFLSIYSSNLDEFYKVRMPVLLVVQKQGKPGGHKQQKKAELLQQVQLEIGKQQDYFGRILRESILPALKVEKIELIYNEPIPSQLQRACFNYFIGTVGAYLQVQYPLLKNTHFFPENNQLYLAILLGESEKYSLAVVTIPANLPRLQSFQANQRDLVIFLDDIIRENLPLIFKTEIIAGMYGFKVTRDADLNLQDELEGDLAEKVEKKLAGRDSGLASRFLYDPAMPEELRRRLVSIMNLKDSLQVAGGRYHNLKDLYPFPVSKPGLSYPSVKPGEKSMAKPDSLFDSMVKNEFFVHTPYHSYNPVLRFFSEAAIDPYVTHIFLTIYRVASESRILSALVTAAQNGKKVTVFVELKARFDEANNIQWAKKLKAAGVKVIYSIPNLKVHAKVALVSRSSDNTSKGFALLSTGNFNETTAKFYTDHTLFTADERLIEELDKLFAFLRMRRIPGTGDHLAFNHLLVGHFNLKERFAELIEREIINARSGVPASITIKLNNLEEESLISKLYEASNAGVKINLMLRTICRLIPGVKNQSENIRVKRIVDRYLEHGRVFIFHNNGNPEYYSGSADWMDRNIHRRIEVCFPIYSPRLQQEIQLLIDLQWADNVQGVWVNSTLGNEKIFTEGKPLRSQELIQKILDSGIA